MQKKISAIIITKNEERRLIFCLESIKDLVEEIIVIDDMSIDDTAKIAKSYGAKVIIQPLNNDFSKQRNIGLDLARNEWILFLDADFVITNDLKEEIKKVLENPGEFVAFDCKLKTFFLGHFIRYAGAYETRKVVLFMKNKARFKGRVHEKLEINGSVGHLKNPIEHYGFHSVSQFIATQNFYTSLMAEDFLKDKGIISKKEIIYHLTIRPLKLFWKLYVRKKGYKDGMYGLVWCMLNVITPTLFWIKYWELIKDKN